MSTTTLRTQPVNGGPFNCRPAMELTLSDERILCNDVTLPWESHPHGMSLWVIWNEYGPIAAVWANHEQDALDEMVDAGLGEGFLVSEEDQASATEDEREEWAHLGNAGEPADLTNAGIARVAWDEARDCRLLARFAEARGEGLTTLDS